MPSSLSFTLPTSSSEEDKADLYFFPDILFYDLDENQYSAEWNKLNATRGGYLMVSSGKLCRVSIFQFLFQHIKGWFGFHNACHPDKIVMSAMKFFYFGYLSEYNQSQATHIMRSWKTVYQPTHFFIQAGNTRRSNVTSTNMQRLLLHFYQTHLRGLQVKSVRPRDSNHPSCLAYQFGQTYALRREWNAFTYLDPQNSRLIQDQLSFFSPTQETLPGSTCRQHYITSQFDQMQALLDKGSPKSHATLKTWHSRVDELLLLWPESKKNYLDFIIQLKSALAEVDESTRSQLRQEIHTLIRSYYSEELIKHSIQRYLKKNQAQTAYHFIEILQERNSKEAMKIIEKNHAALGNVPKVFLRFSQA